MYFEKDWFIYSAGVSMSDRIHQAPSRQNSTHVFFFSQFIHFFMFGIWRCGITWTKKIGVKLDRNTWPSRTVRRLYEAEKHSGGLKLGRFWSFFSSQKTYCWDVFFAATVKRVFFVEGNPWMNKRLYFFQRKLEVGEAWHRFFPRWLSWLTGWCWRQANGPFSMLVGEGKKNRYN